ncbi:MAG: BatA and WFA domain-containing protein, partial [Lachnospiraceae bacterium]|nr:BatA and WFA domain-containing protein [Lachnospiraceae bacterium]
MMFENLWPIALLACVPLIIILYMLRPKGREKTVPTNLIWRKLTGDGARAAFFQRFLNNPLMYLDILIAMLLVAALMSPLISRTGKNAGSVLLVIDTSAGMQQKDENGRTAFEEAKQYASDLAGGSGQMTVVAADKSARILLSESSDEKRIKKVIDDLEVSDLAGGAFNAESLIKTVNADRVIFLTDGTGAAMSAGMEDVQTVVFGAVRPNLAIDYLSASEDGAVAQVANHGSFEAACEMILYDEKDQPLDVSDVHIAPGGVETVLFSGMNISEDAQYIRAEISNIEFAQGVSDAIEKDNENYAFTDGSKSVPGAILGGGNRFLEKAYEASTGTSLTRLENETLIKDEQIVIYDVSYERADESLEDEDYFKQQAGEDNAKGSDDKKYATLKLADTYLSEGTLEKTEVSILPCRITKGSEGTVFGVNKTFTYEVPDWGTSFLEAGGKCAGYYGIDENGRRRIVIGFDIRESNLPLLPQFPVLMAESVSFLADRSLLSEHLYTAGETVKLNPTSEQSMEPEFPPTDKTGIFSVRSGDREEKYAVIFPMEEESDTSVAADQTGDTGDYGSIARIKKSVRRLLAVLSLILLVINLILYVRSVRYKGKGVYILRGVILLLLLLAALDARIPLINRINATIFVADLSESNKANLKQMESYLTEQIKHKPSGDYYALVTFGKDQETDQFLTKSNVFAGIQTSPLDSDTDIEGALSRAVMMLPDGAAGRIVLLTDGRQTTGNIDNMAAAISSGKTELDCVFFDTKQGDDCLVKKADIPEVLHKNDAYTLSVTIDSNYETDAKISLMSDTKTLKEKQVRLSKGSNSFAFEMEVTGSESESFSVRVQAQGDTCPE